MSPVTSPLTDFERNARAVLEESVARIDARTRSRLNQARQLAVDSAGPRRPRWWRTFALMPAGAVAAALVLAVLLWHRGPAGHESPLLEGRITGVEEPDLGFLEFLGSVDRLSDVMPDYLPQPDARGKTADGISPVTPPPPQPAQPPNTANGPGGHNNG